MIVEDGVGALHRQRDRLGEGVSILLRRAELMAKDSSI